MRRPAELLLHNGMAMGNANQPDSPPGPELASEDYYLQDGLLVFTESFHRKRGTCCGSGCRHCPYEKLENTEPR